MKWQALYATRSRAHRKTLREKHTQLSVAASLQKHGSVGSRIAFLARKVLSGWGRSSPLAANFKIFGETTIVRPNLAGAADDLRRDLNYQAIVFAFVALLICDLVFGVLGRCDFFGYADLTPAAMIGLWGVSTIFCAVRHP